MPKTKQVTMLLTVTVPAWMTATAARREVRSLVNDQCGYLDYGPDFEEVTVKVRSLQSPGSKRARQLTGFYN